MKHRVCVGLVVAAAAVAAAPAYADQGDLLARLRVLSIEPDNSTTNTLNTLGVRAGNSIVPELDITYMVTQNIGINAIAGITRNSVSSKIGPLGGVNLLPPTITATWHFNPQGRFRPYLGAGLNYTLFYNNSLHAGTEGVGITNHSFGPALQAGIDVQVTKTLFANVDIKKIFMHTDATLGGAPLGRLSIDPWIIGVGVGMKF